MRYAVDICCREGEGNRFTVQDFSAKMDEKFQEIKRTNPLGFMDEFESRAELLASDIAQEIGAAFDYVELTDKIVFVFDLTRTGSAVLTDRRAKLLAGTH